MVFRKNLIRAVIVVCFVFLVVGAYINLDPQTTSKVYENARVLADKAKYTITGSDEVEDFVGTVEIVDVAPLIQRLEEGDKNFEWADWLDLRNATLFDQRNLSASRFPYLKSLADDQEPQMPLSMKTTSDELALVAMIYCRDKLPSPFRVVVLNKPINNNLTGISGDENLLTSPDSSRVLPLRSYEVTHEDEDRRHRQFGHTRPTVYHDVSEPLVPDLKAPVKGTEAQNILLPRLNASLFTWLLGEILDDDAEGSARSIEDHAFTLRKCLGALDGSGKHFAEVNLNVDPKGLGVHYDWRFFRRLLLPEEQVRELHVLARAWQQFAESAGISYWYAHGSLIGYYWDGMAMPWDADHDIQMPVMELNRLAADFNRTLVVQHPSEGGHKFLIDVNPYFVQRQRGNGRNVIDARFIDIDTGMYIDITGLARTSPTRSLVSCKNRHAYFLNTFERIKRTQFEGYPALVPLDVNSVLYREYRTYNSPTYDSWVFIPQVQLWQFNSTCEEYLNRWETPENVFCYPTESKNDDGCMATYGTCNKYTLQRYEETKEFTKHHLDEMNSFDNVLPLQDEPNWADMEDSINSAIQLVGRYHEPFQF